MKKDERKKRLEDLLKLQKQKEIMQERLQEENTVREAFEEAIGDELEFKVLSFDETELIIKDFTDTFPIAFWNRIEWTNKSVKHQSVNSGEISSIP